VSTPHPPPLARWLLGRLLPPSTREFVLGDLDEEFACAVTAARGAAGARRWYWRQTLRALAALAPRAPRRPTRVTSGDPLMQTLAQDVRFACRLLVKSPGFTAVAVLTLALGIGVNTAIFTWMKALVLEPLPGVPRPGELVMLAGQNRDGTGCCWGTSYPNYLDYQARARTVDILGYEIASVDLTVGGEPERVSGTIVTGNYFDVLGVKAALGRTFQPEEYRTPDTHAVVVISHALWQRRFGSDPDVVGRAVTLNNRPFTIVGVLPQGFRSAMPGIAFDVFVPATLQAAVVPGSDRLHARGAAWLDLIGRLRPGATRDRAQAEMNVISRQIEQEHPGLFTQEGRTLGVYTLTDAPLGVASAAYPVLLSLMAVVGLVLLVACANVANLLLARAAARQREMAVRLAMGARRGQLVRQLLTESLLLAGLAGGLGLLLAHWLGRAALGFLPSTDLTVSLNLDADARVLAFAATVAMATGVVFGLVPALQTSRVDLVTTLKAERTDAGARRAWLRGALVAAQVALSLVALVTAGLFLRSLWAARALDPGFDTGPALMVSMDLFPNGYTAETGDALYRRILDGAAALPGATGATLVRRPPLSSRGARGTGIDEVEGYTPGPNERMGTLYDTVGPDYFQMMGIPLVRGRGFSTRDDAASTPVVVVNQTMARTYWPGEDPLGRHLQIGDRRLEVVGVARDVKYRSIDERARLYMYLPVYQRYEPDETLVVRTAGEPTALVEPLRRLVAGLDPNLALFNVRTMAEHVNGALGSRRVAATGAVVFGLLALALAMVGVYGVVSYTVTRRTHEIGVRVALGARPGDVFRMALVHGLRPAAVGAVIGLAAAYAAARLLRGLLYGVSPGDPATFAAVALLLALVAVAAAWVPARRAMRTDPVTALRYE
jgi:predicted permease